MGTFSRPLRTKRGASPRQLRDGPVRERDRQAERACCASAPSKRARGAEPSSAAKGGHRKCPSSTLRLQSLNRTPAHAPAKKGSGCPVWRIVSARTEHTCCSIILFTSPRRSAARLYASFWAIKSIIPSCVKASNSTRLACAANTLSNPTRTGRLQRSATYVRFSDDRQIRKPFDEDQQSNQEPLRSVDILNELCLPRAIVLIL